MTTYSRFDNDNYLDALEDARAECNSLENAVKFYIDSDSPYRILCAECVQGSWDDAEDLTLYYEGALYRVGDVITCSSCEEEIVANKRRMTND